MQDHEKVKLCFHAECSVESLYKGMMICIIKMYIPSVAHLMTTY